MSLFSNLFASLAGNSKPETETVVEHPCANCPSTCEYAPQACEACAPYKKELIDMLYNVEHLDEFNARYEVVGNAVGGTFECPFCGAPSANRYVCEYCGMTIIPENGKIQVASASEIPNPILDAQDIIYNRYNNVIKQYDEEEEETTASSGGLFSALFDAMDTGSTGTTIKKMTEAEIKEAAELYKLSVADYLTGLDNGTCLNLTLKKKQVQSEAAQQSMFGSGSSLGGSALGGMAALGAAGSLFGGSPVYVQSGYNRPPQQTVIHVQPAGGMHPQQMHAQPVHAQQMHPQQMPTQNMGFGGVKPSQGVNLPQSSKPAAKPQAQKPAAKPQAKKPASGKTALSQHAQAKKPGGKK